MIAIGTDPHKRSHTVLATDVATGRQLGHLTVPATRDGTLAAIAWANELPDPERVWAIEDVRQVSGRLERDLIRAGERVVRVPPRLMAGARPAGRERGKSDPIDAGAIALAAIRVGLDQLPVARLDGVELELRLLGDRREDLVAERTREINRLRWEMHALNCPIQVPERALDQIGHTTRLMAWTRQQTSLRGRLAHDILLRVRELSRQISGYQRELDRLARQHASELINTVPGCGPLTAAKILGHVGDITRFRSEACFARTTGTAPIPVSSGNTNRHRLDRGGNRQLNLALHRIALYQARAYPPAQAYLEKKRAEGKTRRDAIRSLKRHLARTIYTTLLHAHNTNANATTTAAALT